MPNFIFGLEHLRDAVLGFKLPFLPLQRPGRCRPERSATLSLKHPRMPQRSLAVSSTLTDPHYTSHPPSHLSTTGATVTPVTPVRTPARKRSPPKTLSNIVRSELWFSDGNVVIIASSVAFKVHQGQLRRHSGVFDNLFNTPQPKDQNLYDGCPWVEVDDCPSDMLYFLKALYDGLYFRAADSKDFSAIAAVLRLSTKYCAEHLRQCCMAHLELDWPSSLVGWDRREQATTDALGRYAPRASRPHPILVIDLALELGLPSLLPAALYDLSRYRPSKIMAGTPAPPLSITLERAAQRNPVTVSTTLLIVILRGREAAERYFADFVIKELQDRAPAPDCLHLKEDIPSRMCRHSFCFIMLNLLRSVVGITSGRDADLLFTLVQAMDMLSRTDFTDGHRQCGLKLCHPCKVDFAKSATRAREEAWKLLPTWFELDRKARRAEGPQKKDSVAQ
ncbi:hypothetical protein MVEN_01133500 [Mycena venus]|uniref:BTB domain-containing protein n=1 Tax=Mycena venus TaxID=2733690 RepID=A0A8H7CY07_9AGAR|nr:hypothetical protein MVEN_01133500 [Mycena venus]